MNWLIAEDEADIRNLVAMMAQVWGHTAITFESGIKAWEWLESVDAGEYQGDLPDFALMDIRMPGKRGPELSKKIREISVLQHIPIVLMTAYAMGEDDIAKMRREYGVDVIINKPLPDFESLRVMLHQIIEDKKKST